MLRPNLGSITPMAAVIRDMIRESCHVPESSESCWTLQTTSLRNTSDSESLGWDSRVRQTLESSGLLKALEELEIPSLYHRCRLLCVCLGVRP